MQNIKVVLAVLLLMTCFSVVVYGEPAEKAVQAPTDFTFDPNSGEFSFTANDENAGYYFVRAYKVTNGEEAAVYSATSRRIAGSRTGSISSQMDASAFGWGSYNVKLITFAAAGAGYAAPEPIVLNAQFGIGGILERPEMLLMTDGNEVELVIDWYSLSDYYTYQYLPLITFRIYSDEDLTDLILADTVDLSALEPDTHPAGGYMWGEDQTADHKYMNDVFGYSKAIYTYQLEAGTYYVNCQAVSDNEAAIRSSKVSDTIQFTVVAAERSGDYDAQTTTLWQTPPILGVPVAKAGEHTDRIDFGGDQETQAIVVQ